MAIENEKVRNREQNAASMRRMDQSFRCPR